MAERRKANAKAQKRTSPARKRRLRRTAGCWAVDPIDGTLRKFAADGHPDPIDGTANFVDAIPLAAGRM